MGELIVYGLAGGLYLYIIYYIVWCEHSAIYLELWSDRVAKVYPPGWIDNLQTEEDINNQMIKSASYELMKRGRILRMKLENTILALVFIMVLSIMAFIMAVMDKHQTELTKRTVACYEAAKAGVKVECDKIK